MAEVRQFAPFDGVSVDSPRQEAAFYGRGTGAVDGMGFRQSAGLESASVRFPTRACPHDGRLKRKSKSGEFIVVVANFTPIVRYDFWVGVPKSGTYEVIFNSDSEYYSGSNVGQPFVKATSVECQGRPASMQITLPPLALVMFKLVKNAETTEPDKTPAGQSDEAKETKAAKKP